MPYEFDTEELKMAARTIIRRTMAVQGVDFVMLSQRLRLLGHDESNKNLSNRINRGCFSATFMLHCLSALGTTCIEIPGPLTVFSDEA